MLLLVVVWLAMVVVRRSLSVVRCCVLFAVCRDSFNVDGVWCCCLVLFVDVRSYWLLMSACRLLCCKLLFVGCALCDVLCWCCSQLLLVIAVVCACALFAAGCMYGLLLLCVVCRCC